jgi:hypothetical protein
MPTSGLNCGNAGQEKRTGDLLSSRSRVRVAVGAQIRGLSVPWEERRGAHAELLMVVRLKPSRFLAPVWKPLPPFLVPVVSVVW